MEMKKKVLSGLILGLALGASSIALTSAGSQRVWITVGDRAFNELKLIAPDMVVSQSRSLATGAAGTNGEKVHLVQIDRSQIAALSGAIHKKLHRCGGFVEHDSESSGQALLATGTGSFAAAPSLVAPSYAIDNQSVVTPLLSQMQAANIGQTIVDLSSFVNRYYTTTGGVNGSNWIKNKWTTLASGKSYVTVEQFTHSTWAQKSVIMTIQGTDNASEVVVLGGHLDSINTAGTTESTSAPGADDDASGIASLTETIRVLMESNYRPRRTIKFMAYAAEEVGLKGSAEIAKKYKTDGINVVGVIQLDMTNYKGSANDIYLFQDYTNAAQNTFVSNLIKTYQPTLTIGTDSCGYGCSDHASWHSQGYPTSMPFETSMSQDNPKIHTSGDTYANMGSQANHALKFARLATSFAVELGSDGPAVTTTALTKGVAVGVSGAAGANSFYSFVVPSGATNLSISSSGGTGNLDLYTQLGSNPSTTSYLQKSSGTTNTETITIAAPTAGTYYILANSVTATSGASLVANYQITSSNVLSSGVPVSLGSMATNATKTYTISVPAGKTTLTFKTSGGTGDIDIYAKFGSAPTTTSYDSKSDGSTNTETITISAPKAGTYYVFVKAYAAASGASLTGTIQ